MYRMYSGYILHIKMIYDVKIIILPPYLKKVLHGTGYLTGNSRYPDTYRTTAGQRPGHMYTGTRFRGVSAEKSNTPREMRETRTHEKNGGGRRHTCCRLAASVTRCAACTQPTSGGETAVFGW